MTHRRRASHSRILPELGADVGHIQVSIGPRFLDLFSDHLYSSPNKAFEELVSNSWDAGAKTVHVSIPDDLAKPNVAVWVLDDGESMDFEGLRALWAVASGHKRRRRGPRSPIGKFGIGKLATHLLASELTYICRASDGVIRAVTMDYRRIDEAGGDALSIESLELPIRELSPSDLREVLTLIDPSGGLQRLIDAAIPAGPPAEGYEDEFGDNSAPPERETTGTWTLAVLTALKPRGREMQLGHIRRMLRAALPLGASMSVVFNGEALPSAKVSAPVLREWALRRGLGVAAVDTPGGTRRLHEASDHITLEDVPGKVTGTVRLYSARISGGKSEEVAQSNGFHINILGRVVNVHDPYFGLTNLNHSAWAHFRATIRADGLDQVLQANREDLVASGTLDTFRAFLRVLFNQARQDFDSVVRAAWPRAGDVLTDAWATIPMQPLQRVVETALAARELPGFAIASGDRKLEEIAGEWQTQMNPAELVGEVAFEGLAPTDPFIVYDVATRRVVINSSHPFTREYGTTHEQQLVLRDSALAEVLAEAYLLDSGIDEGRLSEARLFKDQTLRVLALRSRRSAPQIASLLLDAVMHAKGFERIVGDALEYVGFDVERMGASGEPEGVARAPIPPGPKDAERSYAIAYDAKSTSKARVKLKDLNIAGLVRHRKENKADHSLAVAPDFEQGALESDCEEHGITPMRARDLATLVMLSASQGAMDLVELRELFRLRSPDEVQRWIDARKERTVQGRVSLDTLLTAIDHIGYVGPNAVTASVLADRIGSLTGATPRRADVLVALRGLAANVPNLVRVSQGDVYLGASAIKIREAILAQLAKLPNEYRLLQVEQRED